MVFDCMMFCCVEHTVFDTNLLVVLSVNIIQINSVFEFAYIYIYLYYKKNSSFEAVTTCQNLAQRIIDIIFLGLVILMALSALQ